MMGVIPEEPLPEGERGREPCGARNECDDI